MLKRTPAALLALGLLPAAMASPLAITLEEAVDRGLAANAGLAATALARDGEREGVQAAWSEFDLRIAPTTSLGHIGSHPLAAEGGGLSGSVGMELRRKLPWGGIVTAGPSYYRSGGHGDTGLTFGLQVPLLAGFGREVAMDAVHRAQFALASAERSHEQARLNLAIEIVSAFHEALRQHALAQIGEALAERLRRHAMIIEGKQRVGLSGPMDTFRARIRLNDSEDAIHQSLGAAEIAKGRLRYLLRLPPDMPIELHASSMPAADAHDAEALAVERRVELRQLRAEHAEAARTAAVAQKATLPDLSLSVRYGQAALADGLLQALLPAQRQWSVLLQASGDIARSAEKLAHRRALLRVQALESAIDDKTAEIRRQVRQQLRLLADARLRSAVRERQILQAEGKLALAQVKFAHDMADNFELVEAENDLYRARSELVAAQTDLAVGLHSLRAMTGDLFDRPAGRIARF